MRALPIIVQCEPPRRHARRRGRTTTSEPRARRKTRPRRSVESRPFFRLVYRVVCRVPKGKVVTYGQVASLAGRPRAARAVGMALGALRGPLAGTVPWHRVIGAGGRCTHVDRLSAAAQRDLLEREGVRFDRRGRVDLRRAGWKALR